MNSLVHERKCKSNCQRPQQGCCDAVGFGNEVVMQKKVSTQRRQLEEQFHQAAGPGAPSLRCQCSWSGCRERRAQCSKRVVQMKKHWLPVKSKSNPIAQPSAQPHCSLFQGSRKIRRIHGLGEAAGNKGAPSLGRNVSRRTT